VSITQLKKLERRENHEMARIALTPDTWIVELTAVTTDDQRLATAEVMAQFARDLLPYVFTVRLLCICLFGCVCVCVCVCCEVGGCGVCVCVCVCISMCVGLDSGFG
jgi:DMSO reductase anchor subunit